MSVKKMQMPTETCSQCGFEAFCEDNDVDNYMFKCGGCIIEEELEIRELMAEVVRRKSHEDRI